MNSFLPTASTSSRSIFLADAPLSEPLPSQSQVPMHPTKDEPMIDQGGQHLVISGVVLFMLGVIAVVGILSRRIEHAIMAALVMSFGLIGLFVATRQ